MILPLPLLLLLWSPCILLPLTFSLNITREILICPPGKEFQRSGTLNRSCRYSGFCRSQFRERPTGVCPPETPVIKVQNV